MCWIFRGGDSEFECTAATAHAQSDRAASIVRRPGWVPARGCGPHATRPTRGRSRPRPATHARAERARCSQILGQIRRSHADVLLGRLTFAAHRARTARTCCGPSKQSRMARLTPSSRASGRRPFSRRRHGERAQRPLQRPGALRPHRAHGSCGQTRRQRGPSRRSGEWS